MNCYAGGGKLNRLANRDHAMEYKGERKRKIN
jgi:hypothetical protein